MSRPRRPAPNALDSACGAAKEAGRNRVHSFEENDLDLMRRRREMQWAARINNALEESRFELFRQTIQPLQRQDTGAHYELLLRMRDENGKIVSPDNFIAAAERYGITPNIDRWVNQFKQPDDKPSSSVAKIEKATFAGQESSIVSVSGRYVAPAMPGGAPSDKPDHSLVAAIVPSPKGPYYFRLVGPKQAVAANEAAFREVLASLEVE